MRSPIRSRLPTTAESPIGLGSINGGNGGDAAHYACYHLVKVTDSETQLGQRCFPLRQPAYPSWTLVILAQTRIRKL